MARKVTRRVRGQQRRKEFLRLLRLAKRCSPRMRVELVNRAPDWFIRALLRASILYTRGKLHNKSKKQSTVALKRRLGRYNKQMKALAGSRKLRDARLVLNQHGGLLPALIPLVTALPKIMMGVAASALASKLASKAAQNTSKFSQ